MKHKELSTLGLIFLLLNLLSHCSSAENETNDPEQLHLSLGTNETEMVITWATISAVTDSALVEYGLAENDLNFQATAEVSHFTDGANFYTYRALMIQLKPDMIYYYRVGSKGSSWSPVYHFSTLPSGANWNPRFAIYGDLGYSNEESLPFLTKDVDTGVYDVIFHVGDFAYDLNDKKGEVGNNFMRSIEKVAALVPYMTCPGNHENAQNFSHYDARFSMIGDRSNPNYDAPLTSRLNNHFHSMDLGPAHIIMFSTEFYYYTNYGWDQIEHQFRYLEEDLKRAHANRAERPWIIVMGHRPIYCLSVGDCNMVKMERTELRQGVHMNGKKGSKLQYGLEDLFFKYGVDMQFSGHEHFYGRLLPLYNFTIMSGPNVTNPYDNPKGPLIIVTGSAGNKERHSPFNPSIDFRKWVAFHQLDYGYTRLTFKDRQNILLEQISDDQNGQIIDQIQIVKTTDKPNWMLDI